MTTEACHAAAPSKELPRPEPMPLGKPAQIPATPVKGDVHCGISYYDPANYAALTHPDDDHRLRFLSDMANFKPTADFVFPVRKCRKYNTRWEEKRPWLRYSLENDSAFCTSCLCFSTIEASASSNLPFLKGGFTNWKKAFGIKDSYLDKHSSSTDHITSTQRTVNFLHTIQNAGSDIHSKISKSAGIAQIRQKKGILSVIDIVIAMGQRGIPFRGNWLKEDQAEDGNFAFFTAWKANFDNELSEHLKYSSKAGKYTSPQIQNEIISLCEKDIRQKIVDGISQYWSILADETQDCSTSEQISICVRYVTKNEVHDFLGFVETEKMDAKTISDKLISSLTEWGLNMDNLVGQGYDGAAVMSSSKNGVQAIVGHMC